jgi:hypothetical protein
MRKRSTSGNDKRVIACVLYVALVSAILYAADAQNPTEEPARTATCETMYLGPPDGDLAIQASWSAGIPAPGMRGCFPDRAGTAVLWGGSAAGQSDPNTPPTTLGVCCLRSSCVETDYFDCRESGGYFLEGIVACVASVCNTGSCCTDAPSCQDDDGLGGDMDESLCTARDGVFVGGALCDASDPCQRFRIPQGFEILEVAPGTESEEHGAPTLNNCGEVIFYVGPFYEPTTELFLYDNGSLNQFTTNSVSDGFPTINDLGMVSWNQGVDGRSAGTIVTGDPVQPTAIGPGPSDCGINNLEPIPKPLFV